MLTNEGREPTKEDMDMLERIKKINTVAQEDFSKAKGMLEMLNDICGTHFGWLAKRVVFFTNADGSIAKERTAQTTAHDAYSNLLVF